MQLSVGHLAFTLRFQEVRFANAFPCLFQIKVTLLPHSNIKDNLPDTWLSLSDNDALSIPHP